MQSIRHFESKGRARWVLLMRLWIAELTGADILRRRKGASVRRSSDNFFTHIDRSRHTFLTNKDEKCYTYLSYLAFDLMMIDRTTYSNH